MSGIGDPPGGREPAVGIGAEPRTKPVAQDGYKWDGATLVIPPTPAPGGMTMSQLIDERSAAPSQASLDRAALEYKIMMTHSRESILKERIRLLEQAMANIEPQS